MSPEVFFLKMFFFNFFEVLSENAAPGLGHSDVHALGGSAGTAGLTLWANPGFPLGHPCPADVMQFTKDLHCVHRYCQIELNKTSIFAWGGNFPGKLIYGCSPWY